jgi:phosphate transport system protein
MSVDGITHHISSRYNEELQQLVRNVLGMGGLVEQQLSEAIGGISEPDDEVILRVARDEQRVNQLEREIDEDCSRILATRSPTASDLRLILTILKTITDLERIGDEGEKIAAIAVRLSARERPRSRYRELRTLGELVIGMLRDALDSFARHDTELAIKVLRRDRIVDEEYESIHRQSITFMMEDPRTIRRALDVMWVVRSLERIGDHSKNICEYLIYLVHGRDVRHTRIDEIERELSEMREPHPAHDWPRQGEAAAVAHSGASASLAPPPRAPASLGPASLGPAPLATRSGTAAE